MKGRRRARKLVIILLALGLFTPFFILALSNVFLLSPPGRTFLVRKFKAKTGLEASIQGASWSPWGGINVYGLIVPQPGPLSGIIKAPLLQMERIKIIPVWRGFIHQQLLIKGIELDKPQLTIPIELLSQIPTTAVDPEITAANMIAIPDTPPVTTTGAAALAQAESQQNPTSTKSPRSDSPPTNETSSSPIKPRKKPAEITSPTVWLNINEGQLDVVSTMTEHPLYRIDQIDGKLPIGGKAAESNLELQETFSLGTQLSTSTNIPIKWESPMLDFQAVSGEFLSIDCQVAARFKLSAGIPFQIQGIIPPAKDKDLGLSEMIHAKIGSITGQGRFQGLAFHPSTWQGEALLHAKDLHASYGDQVTDFDYAHALIAFQNGALRCIDARLLGENISFLTNATLLSDGRTAANARFVAPPEILLSISRRTRPAGSSAPQFTPLSTPQRAALDLQIFGKLGEFYYKPDPASAPVLLE